MFHIRHNRAVCIMLTALLLFSCTGCGASRKKKEEESIAAMEASIAESEAMAAMQRSLEENTVTVPLPENSGELYQEVMATRPAPREPETIPEGETKDCEYTRTGKPAVALTFDDGPRAGSTNQILDVLERYHAKATFFIVGQNVSQDPDAIKREVELGCEIGTHTWSHEDLTKLGNEAFNKQINSSVAKIEEAAGSPCTVMRPPYGAIDSDVKSKLDLPIILWSLDTLDWKTRDADSSLQVIKDEVRGGDIILMHDIHQETADAVEMIVPWLIENGYELLTVTELYEYYGEELDLHRGHGCAR